jgi:hypothetical protein
MDALSSGHPAAPQERVAMDIAEQIRIDPNVIEAAMLSQPQAECPVVHHFGPGVYIREVTLKAGAYALGHFQRFERLDIVLRGKVAIICDDGVRVIEGPCMFVGQPGRKLGYCIEECVWQNVYPNPDNCRDIETLEARWAEKSAVAKLFDQLYLECLAEQHQGDRDDFAKMLDKDVVSAERTESEIANLTELPTEYASRLSVRNSPIEGRGLFLSSPAKEGEMIAPARIGEKQTIAGRYVNHAKNPNCAFRKDESGGVWLYALRDIAGCTAGHYGEELTVDYTQAAIISGRLEVKK